MRRNIIISLIVLLIATVSVVLLKRHVPTVPFEQCSELYQRYADCEGIEASFIQGYRLNDSLRVDVTLLQATDSAAWVGLTEDVWPKDNYPSTEREIIMKMVDKTPVLIVGSPKGHLGLLPDTNYLNNDLVAVCKEKRTVSIFHIECESQINAIMKYHLKETKNSKVSSK